MNNLPPLPATAPEPFELDEDDRPIGRVLSRREVLLLLGAGTGAIALAACVPTGAASPGPLDLAFAVSRVDGSGCVPLEGALVDVWHCDADGRYSGVRDQSFDTSGQAFLRGSQVTDAGGNARFTTIYPGWYQGRAVHIHFKIRTDPDAQSGTTFTSQLYFDDAFTDGVYGAAPYSSRGARTTRNENDGIYGQGGDQLLVPVFADGVGGYAGTFEIGIQLD